MSQPPLSIETETQQVLDELWNEKIIPFRLSVGKVIKDSDEYTIHFHDAVCEQPRLDRTRIIPLRTPYEPQSWSGWQG